MSSVVKLSKAINLIENLASPKQQQRLSTLLDMPVTLIPFTEIAWLESQAIQLRQGDVLPTFDQQDRMMLYLIYAVSEYSKIDNRLRKNTTVANASNTATAQEMVLQLGPITVAGINGSHESNNNNQRLIIIFSYLLLAIAIGFWSRPLWRDLTILQQATEKFGKGQWSPPAQVNKNSVIRPIVDTFTVMARRIERLVNEQKELTNAVSHDLRTPLARLKFSLALVTENLNGLTPDHQNQNKHNIIGMENDINELEALVDEMLSYSRLEAAVGELVFAQVSMNQLLENLVGKLSINSAIKIDYTIADHLIWRCDGHFIERALQNLITNAIAMRNNK